MGIVHILNKAMLSPPKKRGGTLIDHNKSGAGCFLKSRERRPQMRIEYVEFGDSYIRFTPTRGDREDMLDILIHLARQKEDYQNLAVLSYFIDKLREELKGGVQ